MMKKTVLALTVLGTLSGCANSYSAKNAGVPYYVHRGYHLECVKQAQLHGNFKGQADRDSMEQAGAFLAGGLSGIGAIPGLVAYNLAEPVARHNAYYRQCMDDNGVGPKE
jgi:hypothetical protein